MATPAAVSAAHQQAHDALLRITSSYQEQIAKIDQEIENLGHQKMVMKLSLITELSKEATLVPNEVLREFTAHLLSH